MMAQALFVVSALFGLTAGNAAAIDNAIATDPAYQGAVGGVVEGAVLAPSGWARVLVELWFNARPILIEVGLPALLMGFSFPLGECDRPAR